jgi:membrane protease YdiL (CAAX protease family)
MNHEQSAMIRHFTLLAITFEMSLGVLALVLGWLFAYSPTARLASGSNWSMMRDVLLGAGIALVLLGGIVLADRYPVGMLRHLRRTVRDDIVPLFRRTGIGGLLAISIAAGVGEELFFRGFLQAGIADWWGLPSGRWPALLLASVVFGLCHWVCTAYALLATGMGLVLGGLFLLTGHLIAPIVTHAVYDFVVLLYFVRWTAPALPAPSDAE